ncbi:MAG: cupin domain-containing protein [Desulfamplus sp.]|nr:cupin domain-containing protein [Desulfamplus sp.]
MAEKLKQTEAITGKIKEPVESQLFGRDVWIYGDLRDHLLFDTSLNVLCGAKELANAISSKRVFVFVSLNSKIRENGDESLPKEMAIKEAFEFGADSVVDINLDFKDGSNQKSYLLPSTLAKALADVVKGQNPAAFLFPLNDLLREISARCAVLCEAGMIADCQQLKYKNSEIIAVCPSHGGEIMAELGFSDPLKTGFITVQPNAFKKESADKTALSDFDSDLDVENRVKTIFIEIDSSSSKNAIRRISLKKDSLKEQSLESADKVVVGGAGVGNVEGFRNLRRLAAALGAQIGATRPPVIWHWTDDDRLIGQTGKSVRPELLISVGTSGAVQYTAGITEAKRIVAINKDSNAPIFRLADIGVVEDASLFVPALTEKLQQIAMRSLANTISGVNGKNGADSNDDRVESGADFGSKLMQMRKAHQLTHEELAKRTGKNPEFIEELENNRTTPSVGFMIKLSEVFGIDPDTFLNDGERAALSGNRAKEYTRRTGNYYYQNLTPSAENEHLRVFMVTIESNKKHKPVAYRHEGEEFIYVMEGNLELMLDGKVHELVAGESIKFNSETPHQLKSLGNQDTRCLVTLYTP